MPIMRRMLWDVFCRVIDNHGDLGVCWRLAADLASRGERVRLWADDASALAWMAPRGAAGVAVLTWDDAPPDLPPGDVAIEAFGCDPPPRFVARLPGTRCVWINLEYLSAEPYVERSHGLSSPSGAHPKWFFYPGFTPRTGGLLRERDALAPGAFEWAAHGIEPREGERRVSLFAYAHAPFAAMFDLLDDRPTLLLLAAGASQAPALAALAAQPRRHLRAHALPWLDQAGYDRLVHGCDLNFARGEDSIVRAFWAGVPCVWQIYPQHDGVHAAKLEALLDRMDAAPEVGTLWRAWNQLGDWPAELPAGAPWRAVSQRWRDRLAAEDDLVTQLLRFVAARR
jgi:uncharacterized repeat protein (TIGR03837 family)